MILETLYKRSKTGKIVYYKVEVTEYANDSVIRKESGQLETQNPIVHEEEVHQGKNIGKSNETTPQQQAESQAQSDWLKKKDEGYKSLADLNLYAVKGDEGNICYADFNTEDGTPNHPVYWHELEHVLDVKLPEVNTDASGNLKPMLATDWAKVKYISYPVYVQPKLDGVRCLMICNVTDTTCNVRFLSRSGKDYNTVNHIIDNTTFPRGNYIVDGELYSDELTFQEIIQAVKKQCDNSSKIKFNAYDLVNGNEQNYRLVSLEFLISTINSPYITLVPTVIANKKEEVEVLQSNYLNEGYEGAMIRFMNAMYEAGARSRSLLKVKTFDDTEFTFHGFNVGQREEDLIAVCKTEAGDEFRAKLVGTVAEKEELRKKEMEYLGKQLTVKHFGWTDSVNPLPRFPVAKAFRED